MILSLLSFLSLALGCTAHGLLVFAFCHQEPTPRLCAPGEGCQARLLQCFQKIPLRFPGASVTWARSTRELFCDVLKRLARQLGWYLSPRIFTVGHSCTSTYGRDVTLEEDSVVTLVNRPKGWEPRTGVVPCVKVPDILRYVHHLRAEQDLQSHPVC